MKKGLYKILIVLMSAALLGLLTIQVYWLREALISSRTQFDTSVYQAMNKTAEKVNQIENNTYYQKFSNIPGIFDQAKHEVSAGRVIEDSVSSTHIYVTRYELIRSKVPISNQYNDSLTLANLYKQERAVRINKDSGTNISVENFDVDFENTFRNSTYSLERFAKIDAGNKPISKRISISKLDSIYQTELKNLGINTKTKIAVLDKNNQQVLMQSNGYINNKTNFSVPLFKDSDDRPSFYFSTYFPERSASIMGPLIPIAALTILFTLIIIAAFGLAIYYMQMQRKISQVKTDFINNMTHELKTPISTISLATDALKNDKIISDPSKIKHYSALIKQENKRMNQQIEMVLRMSRLEKNEIDIKTEPTQMHSLISQTVEPMRLIVEQERNGTVIEEYLATEFIVDVDPFHFGNIFLNIIENANKYSPNQPNITIKTYNQNNNFIVEVKDQGLGMDKLVLKRIFEKFYRAEAGNIHNVKGQGLGLAYVKKIVELHHGSVWAESEKGKGSSFYIQLPLHHKK